MAEEETRVLNSGGSCYAAVKRLNPSRLPSLGRTGCYCIDKTPGCVFLVHFDPYLTLALQMMSAAIQLVNASGQQQDRELSKDDTNGRGGGKPDLHVINYYLCKNHIIVVVLDII